MRKMKQRLTGIAVLLCLLLSACGDQAVDTSAAPQQESAEQEIAAREPAEEEILYEEDQTGRKAPDNIEEDTSMYVVTTFDDVCESQAGYTIVEQADGYLSGLLDRDGSMRIDYKYDSLYFLDKSTLLMEAEYDGSKGVIDIDDNEIVPFQYDSIHTCCDNQYILAEAVTDLNVSPQGVYESLFNFTIYTLAGEEVGSFSIGPKCMGRTNYNNVYSFDDIIFIPIDEIIDSESGISLSCSCAAYKTDGTLLTTFDGAWRVTASSYNDAASAYIVCIDRSSLSSPKDYTYYEYTGSGFQELSAGVYYDYDYVGNGITAQGEYIDAATGNLIASGSADDPDKVYKKKDGLFLFNADDENGERVLVYNEMGEQILSLPGYAVKLIGGNILYKNTDTQSYKFIDLDGNAIYEERYHSYDSKGNALLLEDYDGVWSLLSPTCEILDDSETNNSGLFYDVQRAEVFSGDGYYTVCTEGTAGTEVVTYLY